MTFKELIMELDQILTSKTQAEVEHTFRNSGANTLEEFACGTIYYLSDGGYSRILINIYDELILAGESRKEVKAQWELAYPLRKALQEMVEQFLNQF